MGSQGATEFPNQMIVLTRGERIQSTSCFNFGRTRPSKPTETVPLSGASEVGGLPVPDRQCMAMAKIATLRTLVSKHCNGKRPIIIYVI